MDACCRRQLAVPGERCHWLTGHGLSKKCCALREYIAHRSYSIRSPVKKNTCSSPWSFDHDALPRSKRARYENCVSKFRSETMQVIFVLYRRKLIIVAKRGIYLSCSKPKLEPLNFLISARTEVTLINFGPIPVLRLSQVIQCKPLQWTGDLGRYSC